MAATVVMEDGGYRRFKYAGGSSFIAPAGDNSTLVANMGGTYTQTL